MIILMLQVAKHAFGQVSSRSIKGLTEVISKRFKGNLEVRLRRLVKVSKHSELAEVIQ